MIYDEQVWPTVSNDDLWIFDKLILSRKLGHLCGPAGVNVPQPDNYIVRPCVNLLGMSRGASLRWIDHDTSDLPPGSFWQEVFEGRHLSIDFENGKQIRCTEGIRLQSDLSRFQRWIIVDYKFEVPEILIPLIENYQYVNIEAIGGKVIEVHLRGNPDFADGAIEAIPIWTGQCFECPEGFKFVYQPDGERVGFFKRY